MSPDLRLVRLVDLPTGIKRLRAEAAGENFRFLDRLIAEWYSGANRFVRRGEVLLGAVSQGDLVAVGGLNCDPYADQDDIGRLRHLYVRRSARRSGIGSAVVDHLLASAEGKFNSIRLRTETREAADFYVRLGFLPVQEAACSHVKLLPYP